MPANISTTTVQPMENSDRYRFLADAMPQIVWTAKPDGNIDYYNKRWFDYTGLTIEQTKDWGWKRVVHPDDLQNCVERWTIAFTTGRDCEVECRLKRASDGVYRWHLGRAFPLRNEEDEIIQWVGTCTDMDDQKRTRSELETRARKEAENELKTFARRLGLATQALQAGIWDWDVRTGLIVWDEKMYELYGIPKNLQVDYQMWADAVVPQDLPEAAAVLQRVIATKSQGSAEFRITLPDGSLRYILAAEGVVLDDADQVAHVIGVNIDVSQRKAGEEALRLSEERFSSAFKYAATGMALVSLEGGFLKVNRALCDSIGYSASELSEKTFQELTHPDDLEASTAKMRQMLDGEINFSKIEKRYIHKEGKVVWTLVSVSLLRDHQNRPLYFITHIEDISESKQAMIRQRELTEKAQAADRAKSEFLANVSHEIRTPMNGVIGMTDLLLSGDLSSSQREFAETIRASGETLLTIINDILDFSKIEAGKLVFETLDFDLVETVESALEILAEAAYPKGVELVGTIAPEVPRRLRGDPGRLRQILTNLICNAIKFTEKGEVVVRVEIADQTGTHVTLRFTIEDTGIGISPVAQKAIFEPFSQADGSTTRKYGGTGLGLAIAKHLATMMEGQIGVLSEEQLGSKFWFTAKFEKQLDLVITRESQKLGDLRVLVVDDNVTNLQTLRQQLLAWRIQADCAICAEESLRMMRDAASAGKLYDFALVDFQMPEMDGLALVRAIKGDPVIGMTRLVLLTSYGKSLRSTELQELGIDSCLIKPIKQSRLFDCLSKATERAAAQTNAPGTVSSPGVPCPAELPRRLEKLRILLADDNQTNRKVALGQLDKLGYAAQAVTNGLEVLKALEQVPYEVILMDCQMPELDGYETTQTIRKRELALDPPCPWRAPVHIIAMTAHAMQGEREKCLAAGMDDYLAKPVRAVELKAVLERSKLVVQNSIERADGSVGEPKSDTFGVLVTETSIVPVIEEECPVDMQLLMEVSGDDPEGLHELVGLILGQLQDLIKKLSAAIQSGGAKEVTELAHEYVGVSASCGMTAIVPPLKALERLGRSGFLSGAEQFLAEASDQVSRIREFLGPVCCPNPPRPGLTRSPSAVVPGPAGFAIFEGSPQS